MNTKTAHKLPVIIKPNAITKKEINQIHQIAEKISDYDHKQQQQKLNADGHSVAFLQHNEFFEKIEPKLLIKIIEIMKKIDKNNWKLIDNEVDNKDNVNVRVIEYHHYITGGGLLNKQHFDGGSIITAVIMLSDPTKDFEGGANLFWEYDEHYKKYDVKQGDMILFPSHKFHSVSTVTKGERYVMVIELWEGEKGIDSHRTGGFSHLLPSYGMINMF
eukprot:249202_1